MQETLSELWSTVAPLIPYATGTVFLWMLVIDLPQNLAARRRHRRWELLRSGNWIAKQRAACRYGIQTYAILGAPQDGFNACYEERKVLTAAGLEAVDLAVEPEYLLAYRLHESGAGLRSLDVTEVYSGPGRYVWPYVQKHKDRNMFYIETDKLAALSAQVPSDERIQPVTDATREQVAYHIALHAIVAHALGLTLDRPWNIAQMMEATYGSLWLQGLLGDLACPVQATIKSPWTDDSAAGTGKGADERVTRAWLENYCIVRCAVDGIDHESHVAIDDSRSSAIARCEEAIRGGDIGIAERVAHKNELGPLRTLKKRAAAIIKERHDMIWPIAQLLSRGADITNSEISQIEGKPTTKKPQG